MNRPPSRRAAARRVTLAAGLACGLGTAALGQVVFHRGNDGDPETLDAHKTSTVSEAHLLRDLSEGLVIHHINGDVVPGFCAGALYGVCRQP